MIDTTVKKRATKTARNPESIFKGAMALSLEDRVQLAKDLKESIQAEVSDLQKKAELAKSIANGS